MLPTEEREEEEVERRGNEKGVELDAVPRSPKPILQQLKITIKQGPFPTARKMPAF